MKTYELARKLSEKELRDWLGEDPFFTEREGYEIYPDVVYPASLDFCEKVAEGKAELPTYVAITHKREIEAIHLEDPKIWKAVKDKMKKDFISKGGALRDRALEVARLVFTAMLREQSGTPIALRILGKNKEKWSLVNPN